MKGAHLEFARAYVANGCDNPKQSAITAGFAISTASQQASKLLRRADVQSYINTHKTKMQQKFEITAEQKLRKLWEFVEVGDEKTSDKITAIVVMNRMQGHDAPPKVAVDPDGRPVTAVVFMPDNGRLQIGLTNVQVNVEI